MRDAVITTPYKKKG